MNLLEKDPERFFDGLGAPMTVTFEHAEELLTSQTFHRQVASHQSFRCMAPRKTTRLTTVPCSSRKSASVARCVCGKGLEVHVVEIFLGRPEMIQRHEW